MFIAPNEKMKRSKDNRRPTIGFFFWRKEWHSDCSTHYHWDYECVMCEVGDWINVWKQAFSERLKDICSEHYRK